MSVSLADVKKHLHVLPSGFLEATATRVVE